MNPGATRSLIPNSRYLRIYSVISKHAVPFSLPIYGYSLVARFVGMCHPERQRRISVETCTRKFSKTQVIVSVKSHRVILSASEGSQWRPVHGNPRRLKSSCHPERQRRISVSGMGDPSLALRMTLESRFVASCPRNCQRNTLESAYRPCIDLLYVLISICYSLFGESS